MSTLKHKTVLTSETTSTWEPSTSSHGDWYTADSWSPNGVPANSATFEASSLTAITFSKTDATIDDIEFAADAPCYTFTFATANTSPALTITGKGVTNHSKEKQSFIVASNGVSYKEPQLKFTNKASAGGINLSYFSGPGPTSHDTPPSSGFGGGIIGFCDDASAGSASFTVTTGATPPPKYPIKSTVGGEVSFSNNSTAESANFTIYGSTSTTDGDTFGNVVFHDTATAGEASFTNIGGTKTFKNASGEVTGGGDGGNTQFYGNSSAANAVFDNKGATALHANGGDVAFDGTADAGNATFNNHPATVYGAYGGVTSFNNNPPNITTNGTSAGHAHINNYGANTNAKGGGGHTEFSARHGSPTAKQAIIHNYGSEIVGPPSKYGNAGMAGHTIFSINLPTDYYPTAGNATIYNHPGSVKGAAAGYTEFSVYSNTNIGSSNVPTAGHGTFINLGAESKDASGGYTSFSGTSSAGNATLIARGGSNDGDGGKIAFYDNSNGDAANVQLFGNGTLDLSDHTGGLTIASLFTASTEANINIQLGTKTTDLKLTGALNIQQNTTLSFAFWAVKGEKVKPETNYTVLTASNLSSFTESSFEGSLYEYVKKTKSYKEIKAHFTLVDNNLHVSFRKA